MTQTLEQLAAAARDGDRRALEELVRAIHDPVHRLALRMTACPADAEDSVQEITIRVITRLASYRGDAAFLTWVHRVAVNHLLDRAKSPVERLEMTFAGFADDLLDGLAAGPSSSPDAALLEREVQLACTHALLTCLDREHRVAYILGDVLEMRSEEAAYICEVPAATYRKRLSRARARVQAHLRGACGLVNPDAACRCSRRVDAAVRSGRVDPARPAFVDPRTVEAANDEVVRLHDAASLLRSLPQPAVPAASRARIQRLLSESGLAAAG